MKVGHLQEGVWTSTAYNQRMTNTEEETVLTASWRETPRGHVMG